MKKSILSFLITLSCALYGYSQDVKTSTIQWSSIKTFDVGLSDSSDEATTLVSSGGSQVDWKDEDGNIKRSFQIVEVIGVWTNPNSEGSLLYEVTDSTSSGTITIRKDGNGTKVLFVLVSRQADSAISNPPQTTELTIQSFQVL